VVKPQAKQTLVHYLMEHHPISERKACALLQIHRATYRYQAAPVKDDALRARLKALATEYPSYGYLILHGLLKQEQLVVNKKQTYRLYKEENLQVRTKRRKKLYRPRQALLIPAGINQRWSMDFVSDQLSNGRRIRIFNVVDDFSRESVGQFADTSISGEMVSRFLSQLIAERGKPQAIVCDNGPEFTSKALFFWSQQTHVRLSFIQPGKPTQNVFVESFNGKFRSDCLNQHWFRDLDEARETIEQWRQHYNHVRPHSSLNYLPPSQYAKMNA
jgi:putative transposase